MKSLSITNCKNTSSKWILYYLFLGIIQALWTNPSAFPPLPLRLLMNIAVFVPMFFRKECVVFGIPFFMILRGQLGTEYQYLPDVYSYRIYISLLVLLLLLYHKKLTKRYLRTYLPLILIVAYMSVIDIIGIAEFGMYVMNLSVVLLFSFFVSSDDDANLIASALLCVCTILAVYYLCMYNQFLETWNAAEGIERSGWNDPNYFSTLLGTGIVISVLYLLGYLKSDFILMRPMCLTVFIIAIYMAIALTASRAGFISSSIIIVFAIIKSRPRISTFFLFIVLSVLCIILMYKLGVFDTLLYRLFEQGNLDTGGGRTTLWIDVIQKYNYQPFMNQLFGGGYWYRAQLSGGSEMHNELMAIWTDYGYIGLILYVVLIVSMLLKFGHTHKARVLAVIYYMLMIISLSPFQYVNVGFFLVWILSLKLTSSDVAYK